ncbi:DLA class II histocompatibility antigen, DR-1 beta chain-like, partial [Pseudonaja textilis]|uniref:DLA class II histocompatibility antigen, DR-1 beta chain-like n=1 Tax=Pseudonaja textilis TaxID=8673 RepID=UPI000EA86D6C
MFDQNSLPEISITETKPTLLALIKGRRFTGLLDSGADVSVIRSDEWPTDSETETSPSVRGVGGIQTARIIPKCGENSAFLSSDPPSPPGGPGASASFSPLFAGACGAASMALAGLPLVLLVGALGRIPGSEGGKETPAHFLLQWKHGCLFLNGTQQVRYLNRYFYDRQEFVRFDSDLGKHVAITALGEVIAETMNSDKQWMQVQKAEVDRFCRHNYDVGSYEVDKREERMIGRR